MTLVTAQVGGGYAVMTADTLVMDFRDPEAPVIADKRGATKVQRLTDSTLIGFSGGFHITKAVRENLDRIVKPDDDVDMCAEKLQAFGRNELADWIKRHISPAQLARYPGSVRVCVILAGLNGIRLIDSVDGYEYAIVYPPTASVDSVGYATPPWWGGPTGFDDEELLARYLEWYRVLEDEPLTWDGALRHAIELHADLRERYDTVSKDADCGVLFATDGGKAYLITLEVANVSEAVLPDGSDP